MTGGAAHQAGSQGVTVPNLMHPWPTVDMGQDERGVLLLGQSQEVQANVLLGPEQRVLAFKHLVTAPCLAKLADMTGTFPALTQVKVVRMCASWWSSRSTPLVMWWKWAVLFR
jgi:hypothetical protein